MIYSLTTRTELVRVVPFVGMDVKLNNFTYRLIMLFSPYSAVKCRKLKNINGF